MRNLAKILPLFIFAGAAGAAGGGATLTIDGTTHEFPEASSNCSRDFKKKLYVLLVNSAVHFQASELDPAENTWTIKYNIPLGDRKYDEYFTRKHETKRTGNTISGTARAEDGDQPGKFVDISYEINCGDI